MVTQFEESTFRAPKKIATGSEGKAYQNLDVLSFATVKAIPTLSVDDMISEKLGAEKAKLELETQNYQAKTQELNQFLAGVSQAIGLFEKEKEILFNDLQKQTVDLAMRVAEVLLGHQLELNSEVIQETIKVLMGECEAQREKTIHLSKSDHELLLGTSGDWLNSTTEGCKVLVDDNLRAGHVLIKADALTLEGGPIRKLDHLRQQLREKGVAKTIEDKPEALSQPPESPESTEEEKK